MLEPVLWVAAILVLILAQGLLSAAEVAVLGARPGCLETRAAAGSRSARRVQALRADPEAFLAAVQTGQALSLTLAGIVAGFAAHGPVASSLQAALGVSRGAALAVAAALASLALAYASLTLGTALPRALARHRAERVAVALGVPVGAVVGVLSAAVAAVTSAVRGTLRLAGVRRPRRTFVGEEDVRVRLPADPEAGVLDSAELPEAMARFSETPVRQLMVPRAKVFALDLATPPEEVVRRMGESGCSRIPVYDGSIDDVVGLVYIKDVLRRLERSQPVLLTRMLHAVHYVPETKRAGELLRELRRRRRHLAMVIDEHGSVTGLVTLEDLIEEIVGEIHDEYDLDERPVERLDDGSLVAEGTVSADELRREYGVPIPESDEFETVAGYVLDRLGSVPRGGETVEAGGFRMTVLSVERHRITKVKLENVRTPVETR